MAETLNILRTKLYPPKTFNDHVYRVRLIEKLNNNYQKNALTLVSAPAGYGKSYLVSCWLNESNIPFGWVSLSEDDNDLRTFLEYLVAAVEKVSPGKLEKTSDLLQAAELPPVSVILNLLINELDEIDREFVLVLDDYHLIKEKKIHDLIDGLLQYPPDNMVLCIITRRDPPLKIGSLRAYNRMNEIRMEELSFTVQEIPVLYKNMIGLGISEEMSENLLKRTEGWVAGLRLTAHSVKTIEQLESMLKKMKGENRLVTEYLVEEVLSSQPEEYQKYLMKTSLLDRFCADVVEVLDITESTEKEKKISGKEFIEWLEKTNLFVIPLDDENKWFRYHHEFQRLLQKQLKKKRSTEQIKTIHKKVYEWFDKYGYMEETVEHAIEADDLKVVVDYLISYRYELMETGQMHRLNRLMDLLPESIIEKTPALLTTKSFIMEYRGQIAEWIEFKEKAKALLSNMSTESKEVNTIRGEVETIEGELFLISGDGKSAFESSQRALELLPASASYFRSYALGTTVVSYQILNDIESLEKFSIEYKLKSNFSEARIQGWYSIAFAMEGDTARLKKTAQKSIELSEKYQFSESVVYGKYFLSVAHYLSLEDDQAEPYLKSVVDDPYIARPHFLANCAFMLSSIYIEKGEVEKADQLMDFIIKHLVKSKDTLVTVVAKAMRVDLALKEQNIEKALLLNDQQESYVFYPPLWFIYVSQLTPIKLKLAINTTDSVTEAIQMLTEIEATLRQTNKKTILTDVLILKALAFKAQEKEKEALEILKESIELSLPGKIIRPFIEAGLEMEDLLKKLLTDENDSNYIKEILKQFNFQPETKPSLIKDKNTGNLLEHLTEREIEILTLLSRGLKNREIGDKIFLAQTTVKRHIYNIYQKLDVHSRIEVVTKARELGLIS